MSPHVHAHPSNGVCILWQLSGGGGGVGRRMYWIQKATLLCQGRSFNQVFYIHQLCPRSKQRLYLWRAATSSWVGGVRGGVAVQVVSNGRLAQAAAAQTEKRLHVSVCLRDKQRWSNYRRLLRKD